MKKILDVGDILMLVVVITGFILLGVVMVAAEL